MTVLDFTSVINSILPEPHAGLLNGILFGTKATLSKDLYDALIKTSTLHIIALSGMNITILTNLVSITLLRLVSRRIASLLTIVIIIGFILFVGVSASVVRAGIMGSLALLAVVFGRQTWSLLFLIIAAASMLIIKPDWIADIGFQLSVLASLGIILFGKKLGHVGAEVARPNSKVLRSSAGASAPSAKNLNLSAIPAPNPSVIPAKAGIHPWYLDSNHGSRLGGRDDKDKSLTSHFQHLISIFYSLIEDDLRVTLAAQTFTVPLILFHFHRVSLISPLTNILIGWMIQPVTILGLVAAVVGWIFLPLGMVVGWVVWVPLQYMLLAIQITGMLPFASLSL